MAATSDQPRAMLQLGTAERYEKLSFLGDGQFGVVYKARDKVTNDQYAIKKIRVGQKEQAKEGIHQTALREVKLLQELRHENVVGLIDVFATKGNINLVFDIAATDLEDLIKDSQLWLSPEAIKSVLLQTLLGLEYLHANWVLHRDLKPGNLLLTSTGVVKITDFGLATFFGSPSRKYTHVVATIWYRPPELLFGATLYGGAIDMWAIGCIQAELELRVPLFPGTGGELDQLEKIFQCLGECSEEDWPEANNLPLFIKPQATEKTPFSALMSAASEEAVDLIDNLLIPNPSKRLTAKQALQHPYFSSDPPPCRPQDIPLPNKDKIGAVAEEAKVTTTKRKLDNLKDSDGLPLGKKLF